MSVTSEPEDSRAGFVGSVMFVVTGLGVGGAERQVVDLAVGLSRRGAQVSVVSLLPPEGLADELSAAGVAIHSLGMRRGRPSLGAVRRLRRLVGQSRPDVVHSHMVHANLLTRISIGSRPDRVRIDTAHNVIEGGRWRDVLQRLTRRRTDWITTVSQAAFDRYARLRLLDPGRASIVPNGVAIGTLARGAVPARTGDGPFHWVCVARLAAAKSLHDLITAIDVLTRRGSDLTLSIAGEGPDRARLEKQIRRFGLVDRISLLGEVKDVASLLNGGHGFVLSSTIEGLPLALLEAAAVGLPAVTTDAGGCREAIVDGVSGLVVPSGSPAVLADAMEHVMRLSEPERREWGAAGRAFVRDNYDIDQVLTTWSELYERLSGARSAG